MILTPAYVVDETVGCATFYTTGMEHSPTSATGTAWERTPWGATQRAAWEAGKSRWLGQSLPPAQDRGHRFARASSCPGSLRRA
jgi:hypothetical protein